MANPMDPSVAVDYGKFVEAAYSMFKPGVLNPPPSSDFPTGYKLLATIQLTDFFGDTNTREFYGFIALNERNSSEAVLAIRGTSTLTEWWDDFHWALVPFSQAKGKGNVAEGFQDIYNTLGLMFPGQLEAESVPSASFRADTMRVLQENTAAADSSDLNLVVAGHSLGSALTTLYALDVAINNGLQPELYTFASPRVGDTDFTTYFDAQVAVSWRIYNEYDVVPYFPKDPFDNYSHVATGYEVGSLEKVRWSLSCEHSLTTYLFLVDSSKAALGPDCQPVLETKGGV